MSFVNRIRTTKDTREACYLGSKEEVRILSGAFTTIYHLLLHSPLILAHPSKVLLQFLWTPVVLQPWSGETVGSTAGTPKKDPQSWSASV